MTARKALLACLERHARFVLTTHLKPDGDALGSMLALGQLLRRRGRTVHLFTVDLPPPNLSWLPGLEQVELFTGTLAQRTVLAQAEVICVLDTNALERLGALAEAVASSRALKVLIDHHRGLQAGFDLAYVRSGACATGELVYELVRAVDRQLIDSAMATALYVAIMTDTGSFRFNTVRPRVHRIVAELLARGRLLPEAIHSAIFDRRTPEGMRLLGLGLQQLQLRYGGRLAYMVLSRRMFHQVGADSEDTEGFVNQLLTIEGVQLAVLFTELRTGVKISFRSKGAYAVDRWARAWGGGGHRNASGAYVEGAALEPLVEAVVVSAARHVPRLATELAVK